MMFAPPAVHWFFVLWMAVIVLVFVVIVLAIIRALSRPHQQTFPASPPISPTPPSETPLDILARRFAKGEITAEEYQKARDLLGGGDKPV
jgi:uncharacterized membrane protein